MQRGIAALADTHLTVNLCVCDCRTDFSVQLASNARVAFAENISRGEAGMHVAAAALQIAAEDDAIGVKRPDCNCPQILY